ncbi:LicD family protein [Oenococcus sicerae]|nr:LicD family protein [Oenococcus sicerae]
MEKRELALTEVRKIELQMLIQVRDFCEEHHLQYFLHGGTLIGALRHKGFIPWDDDIDISMPRVDYEVFLNSFPENSNYRLLTPMMDNYYFAFSKLTAQKTYIENSAEKTQYGVFLDIFPIDDVPDNRVQSYIFFIKASIYKKILGHLNDKVMNPNYNFGKKLYWKILRSFNYKKILTRFSRLTKQTNHHGGLCSTVTTGVQWFIVYKKSWFAAQVPVFFEGEKFSAPIGYDAFLKKYFGNYMELPPREKRVAHNYKYWIESENE